MKTAYRVMLGVMFTAAIVGCRDKETEKKIAELESRLAAVEKKSPGATPATLANPVSAPAATPPVAEEKPTGPLPVAEFERMEHDFGTVNEGEKVSYTYKVKNTGQAPLIIEKASPSCGCTVPDWSKSPIPVGGSGFVKAEFDTHSKVGIQNKTITVTTNAWPRSTVIKFTAMVVAKAEGGPVKH